MLRFLKIFILIWVTIPNIYSSAQNSIGVSAGGSLNRFYDYQNNDNYTNGYEFKPGFNGALSYTNKLDSNTHFRTELQYSFSELKLEARTFSSSSSFYNNSQYKVSHIRLNLDYLFRLNDLKKRNEFDLLFGMSLGYAAKASVVGNGRDGHYVTVEDSSGNQTSVWRTFEWNKNESNSKDFTVLNFGLAIGFEFCVPLKKNIELFIQNKYHFYITKALRINTADTYIFTTSLSLGLKFNL